MSFKIRNYLQLTVYHYTKRNNSVNQIFLLTINKNQEKALKRHLKIKEVSGIHEKKLWKKVSTYKKFFSIIPGTLCICIGNSLAMNACHKDSDIDLFIITKSNRIWTSRVYFTLLLTLLGQRKTKTKHAGKFCLSFFITEDSMNLEYIAIEEDIYLTYWIKTLIPIINRDSTFENFKAVNHEGITKQKQEQKKGILTGLGDIQEKVFKHLLLPRTKKSFQKLGKPFGVIISDTMLKFHDTDKRKDIRDSLSS